MDEAGPFAFVFAGESAERYCLRNPMGFGRDESGRFYSIVWIPRKYGSRREFVKNIRRQAPNAIVENNYPFAAVWVARRLEV